MTTFVEAVANQEERTENGMKARKSTANLSGVLAKVTTL